MTETKAHCPRCGYEWNTKSVMFFVSCPKCRKLVDIRGIVEDSKDGEE